MKEMRTVDAVGQVLCHDITQIIPGVTKGPVFRKGHIIQPEDIEVLLQVGKDHIFVWEKDETVLHEDEAAQILYDICVGNQDCIQPSAVKEGKIELLAAREGLLKIDEKALYGVNHLGEMMIATRHTNLPVKAGEKLAGTRIIPLVIEKEKMEQARKVAGAEPIVRILPIKAKKVAVITTGNEVYYNRIQDCFTPVLCKKLAEYGATVMHHEILPDDHEQITKACLEALHSGAEMVLCTGGMSVDPDDKTPLAIKNTGADIVTYGAPVLPGAMLLLAYTKEGVPIVGLPGCVMYAKRTIFDLILPRLLADDKILREEMDALGLGGLCLGCDVCYFPNCGFGTW